MADEESTEDAGQNGRLRTTKPNENIHRMAAVLKGGMIAERMGIPKPSFTGFCLMI